MVKSLVIKSHYKYACIYIIYIYIYLYIYVSIVRWFYPQQKGTSRPDFAPCPRACRRGFHSRSGGWYTESLRNPIGTVYPVTRPGKHRKSELENGWIYGPFMWFNGDLMGFYSVGFYRDFLWLWDFFNSDFWWDIHGIYPLVNVYRAIENGPLK